MFEIESETPIPLSEAARMVGPAKNGRPLHLSTLLRWITTGCRAPGGRRVRLEAVRIGSTWKTSRQAIARFVAALTPDLDAPQQSMPRSPNSRQRASERAARQLEKFGI